MTDYKGLTIRIGGDVEPLQRALKAASSSAYAAQRDLQSLTRAMKFDGNNFAGLQRSAQLTKNRIEDLATKATELRSAMAQLGKQTTNIGGAKNIKELAKNTENIELVAHKATQRYNELNKMLEVNYNGIEKIINKSVPLSKAFDFHDIKSIHSLIEDMEELNIITDKDTREFEDMVDSGRQLEAVAAVLKKVKENSNVLDGVSTEQLDELAKLAPLWQKAANEQKAYNQAAKYDKMKTDLTALNAEVDGLSSKLGKASANMRLSKGFEDAKLSLQSLDNQAIEVSADFKRVGESLKVDPKNFSTVRRGFDDLQKLSNIAQAKVELLNKQLAELKSKGADKVAASMGDTATATQKAADEVAKLTAQYSRAQAEVQKYQTQLDKLEKNGVNRQSEEWQQVETALQQASERVDKYSSALEKAKDHQQRIAEGAEFKRVEAEAQDATLEVERTTQAVKEVQTGKKSVSETADEFNKLGDKAQLASEKINLISRGYAIENIGQQLTSTITQPLWNLGQSVMDTAIQVDDAYRNMRKTVDGTEAQFRELKRNAQEFATSHFTSADQVLEIEALGGELGVATENLESFATAVSNIDIATDLNAEEAATDLGQLSNVMHLGEQDYNRFADSLVRLGNNGASTESQIMDVSSRIGSMGSIVGMTAPEVLAWASAIASTGQNSEAAGTALSKTMSQIESAVGKGGDAVKGFADVAGMSAQEFTDTWNNNPTEALKAFINGLKRVEESGGSASNTLENLGIKGVRQKQGIEGLMQTVDKLDDNLEMSVHAWNGVSDQWGAAGDAAREAQKKTEGLSGTVQRAKNMAQNAMSSIGDAVTPFIKKAVDGLENLYNWFMKLPAGTKRMIVGIAGVSAATGPLLQALGLLIKNFGLLTKTAGAVSGIQKLVEAFKLAKSGAGSLTEALAATGSGFAGIVSKINPTALAITGIVAVLGVAAAAWLDYKAKQEEAREHQEKLNKAFSSTAEVFDGVKADIKSAADAYDELKGATDAGVDSLIENNDRARESFKNLANTHSELDTVTGTIQKLTEKMGGVNDTSKLTEGEVEQLKEAFSRYNQIVGTSYDVTDNTITKDGEKIDSLEDLNKALQDNAREWEYNASVRADYDSAVEYQKTADEAARNMRDAEQQHKDAVTAHNKAVMDKENYKNSLSKGAINSGALSTTLNPEWRALVKAEEDAQAAVESTQQSLDDATGTYNNAKQRVEDLTVSTEVYNAMHERMKDAIDQSGMSWSELKMALNGVNLSQEQFAKMSNGYVQKALQDSGGDAKKFAEQLANCAKTSDEFNTTLTSWQKDVPGFADLNLDVGALAQKLAEAGVASSALTTLGSQNFTALANSCKGDIDLITSRLSTLDKMHLTDKVVSVDDGGTITLTNGALLDLNKMTLGNKKIQVNDDGSIEVVGEGMLDLDKMTIGDKKFRVTDTGDIEYLVGDTKDLKDNISKIPQSTDVNFASNATDVKQKFEELKESQDNVTPETPAGVDSNAIDIAKWMGYIPSLQSQIAPEISADIASNVDRINEILGKTPGLQNDVKPVIPANVSTDASDTQDKLQKVTKAQNNVNPLINANVTSNAQVSTGKMQGLRGAEDNVYGMIYANASSDAQVSTGKFQTLLKAQRNVPGWITANVNSNANATKASVDNVGKSLDKINGKTATVTTRHNIFENVTRSISNFIHNVTGEHASGGVYIPHATGGIRLHASGGYAVGDSSYVAAARRYDPQAVTKLHQVGGTAVRPTWYGQRDIVGEAGAEAIVPLTNRRYSEPFVNMIADGIVDRLNGLGTDAATAAQVNALRHELPQLMATYQTKIGGREFTRMVNKYGSMQA